MGKYHNVLYVALKTAWNWDVKDSAVICALLSMISREISNHRLYCFQFFFSAEIYDCEKTFERLFIGAIFGSNAPYFIAGWRSDFKDQVNWKLFYACDDRNFHSLEQDENCRAVAFFTHHACRRRLMFDIEGRKIP